MERLCLNRFKASSNERELYGQATKSVIAREFWSRKKTRDKSDSSECARVHRLSKSGENENSLLKHGEEPSAQAQIDHIANALKTRPLKVAFARLPSINQILSRQKELDWLLASRRGVSFFHDLQWPGSCAAFVEQHFTCLCMQSPIFVLAPVEILTAFQWFNVAFGHEYFLLSQNNQSGPDAWSYPFNDTLVWCSMEGLLGNVCAGLSKLDPSTRFVSLLVLYDDPQMWISRVTGREACMLQAQGNMRIIATKIRFKVPQKIGTPKDASVYYVIAKVMETVASPVGSRKTQKRRSAVLEQGHASGPLAQRALDSSGPRRERLRQA
jgi:hypothetical protein